MLFWINLDIATLFDNNNAIGIDRCDRVFPPFEGTVEGDDD
jgi:hypothetical protein